MRLPSDIFLALRYLKPKRTFVSMITLLSVLGPVLGVALLVIVTAIMSGFDQSIRLRILNMQAHLQVFPPLSFKAGEVDVIENPDPVVEAAQRAGAKGAPVAEGPVLLQVKDQIVAKLARGIIPELERHVTSLGDDRVVTGRFEIKPGEALIGSEMAASLNLRLGDHFLLHAPKKLTRNLSWEKDGSLKVKDSQQFVLPEEVTVVGIFNMGVYEFDSSVVFLHLDQACDLFGLPLGSATAVQVRTPDPFVMDGQVQALQESFPTYRFLTWKDANRQLFGALRVEKNLMMFLLVFIVIVAAFGIAGTLITVVVQKTREIGIMKAVGLPWWMVANIFMLQGAMIGVFGAGAGTLLGALVVHYRNLIQALLGKIMGVEVFPRELYQLSEIPAKMIGSDVALIAGVAVVICIAGAVVPALFASALSPAAALREDN